MKDFLIYLPLTVLYMSAETALFPSLPLPDLALIIIFYISHTRASVWGVVLAFSLGYVDDVFHGAVVGTSSFALVLVFVIVHLASHKMEFSSKIARAWGAALLTLMKALLAAFAAWFASAKIGALHQPILPALATGLAAPYVLPLLERLTLIVFSPAERREM